MPGEAPKACPFCCKVSPIVRESAIGPRADTREEAERLWNKAADMTPLSDYTLRQLVGELQRRVTMIERVHPCPIGSRP